MAVCLKNSEHLADVADALHFLMSAQLSEEQRAELAKLRDEMNSMQEELLSAAERVHEVSEITHYAELKEKSAILFTQWVSWTTGPYSEAVKEWVVERLIDEEMKDEHKFPFPPNSFPDRNPFDK
jgi:chorismate mutase